MADDTTHEPQDQGAQSADADGELSPQQRSDERAILREINEGGPVTPETDPDEDMDLRTI